MGVQGVGCGVDGLRSVVQRRYQEPRNPSSYRHDSPNPYALRQKPVLMDIGPYQPCRKYLVPMLSSKWPFELDILFGKYFHHSK